MDCDEDFNIDIKKQLSLLKTKQLLKMDIQSIKKQKEKLKL